MSDCVAFAKTLVGPLFNTYTDKFIKSMSGFNAFIKTNIAEFDGSPNYALVKISEGKLSPVTSLACTYNTADGETILTWDENFGNNGIGGDKAFWCIYDDSTGLWYFADGEVTRDTETDTQTISAGLTATDLHCYLLTCQYTSYVLTLISANDYAAVTAP